MFVISSHTNIKRNSGSPMSISIYYIHKCQQQFITYLALCSIAILFKYGALDHGENSPLDVESNTIFSVIGANFAFNTPILKTKLNWLLAQFIQTIFLQYTR